MFEYGRLVVLLLVCVPGGCNMPGKPDPANAYKRPDQIVDFAVLYGRHCAACHGAAGKVGPAPPLNDPLFLAIVPDDELRTVVAKGRQGTSMPAFARDHGGHLTDEQIGILAAGLKSRWSAPEAVTDETPTYRADPGSPPGNKADGMRTFARACGGCHGETGEGAAQAGAVNDPSFLALVSDQVLRRYVITGRPDLGMPSYRERTGRAADFAPLSSQEIADVVALLASWRRQ
jgi:cytochrome c oxidase cbb3-type subunit 3/ubiquinol-cytochrome c reductase cytochrome c subunit